jgi:hypothetical protein
VRRPKHDRIPISSRWVKNYLAVKDARERIEKSVSAAKELASNGVSYAPLSPEEEAADIARRLQTVQKHKRKQMKQAFFRGGWSQPSGRHAGRKRSGKISM